MTTATVLPRHARPSTPGWRAAVQEWRDSDHAIRGVLLVPAALSGLVGIFGLGYALLFG